MKTVRTPRTITAFVGIVIAAVVLLPILISGKVSGAIYHSLQGWCCHYVAQALMSSGKGAAAIEWQERSIEGYELAQANVASNSYTELVCDELSALANMSVKVDDSHLCFETFEKLERVIRAHLAKNPMLADAYKFRRFLLIAVINQARLLAEEGKIDLAIEKYRALSVDGEALVKENKSNELSDKILADGRKEILEIQRAARR